MTTTAQLQHSQAIESREFEQAPTTTIAGNALLTFDEHRVVAIHCEATITRRFHQLVPGNKLNNNTTPRSP